MPRLNFWFPPFSDRVPITVPIRAC